jgi:hypothetical protein
MRTVDAPLCVFYTWSSSRSALYVLMGQRKKISPTCYECGNPLTFLLVKHKFEIIIMQIMFCSNDKVPRNIMWWALQKHKVSTKYITLIKDMYDNVVTSVQTSDRDTNDFSINIGLHQGSALSPYLFALVMDEVTRDIQDDIPWCMLFADDVVLVDESRTRVDQKLSCVDKLWSQNVLGLVGLKQST